MLDTWRMIAAERTRLADALAGLPAEDWDRLRATDAQWQHGSGPPVEGPAIALVMAMTGRKVALEDLSGEGVGVLRSRD